MAAEQARDLYKEKKPEVNIVVIKTKSVAQGFIAANMFVFDSESLETIERDIYQSIEGVSSVEITTATRNTTVSGVKVTKGHYIGIINHQLVVDNKELVEALVETIGKDEDLSDKENVLLIYGANTTDELKKEALESVKKAYPSLEVSEIDGGQDVYFFNVAIF